MVHSLHHYELSLDLIDDNLRKREDLSVETYLVASSLSRGLAECVNVLSITAHLALKFLTLRSTALRASDIGRSRTVRCLLQFILGEEFDVLVNLTDGALKSDADKLEGRVG